ncbi:MAG: amidohydrolase [Actinobacteria bacterium]|nr:MAG: amidohydrolase [Actinomycetota bacterium]
MSTNGWLVADSDMHILEPADLWTRYMDPRWRYAAPIGLTELQRDMRVKVKNRVIARLSDLHPGAYDGLWDESTDSVFAHAEAGDWDAKSQLAAMDMEHLDSTVLFPSRGLFVLGLQSTQFLGNDGLEPDLALEIARAYNNWLHDFRSEAPDRMHGAAMLAPHDVAGSVDELARCVGDLGFKAAFLTPGLPDRRPWHDPVYDPIWRECVRLDVPACFHGGGKTYLEPDFAFSDHLGPTMMWHPFNQPLGIMFVVTCLTAGGVLERFPDLRIGLLEGNCSWAPWLAYRLDEHYEWLGKLEAPYLTMKPSRYLLRNCFLSVEADEAPARHYIDEFGDDNLVFSTDYPHADAKFPRSTESFLELPFAESSKRKILWDNYAKLYRLPEPTKVA